MRLTSAQWGAMIGVFCLSVLAGLPARKAAFADEVMTFRIFRKDVPFTLLTQSGVTISSGCVSAGKLLRCEASAALAKVNLSKVDIDLFGRNPGEALCSHQLGGGVVASHDGHGGGRTFCRFKDGSMVSSGTLARFGKKNETR